MGPTRPRQPRPVRSQHLPLRNRPRSPPRPGLLTRPLGFVHTGTQHAFVYDIADLYKADTTLPVAFSLHQSPNPEQDARRKFREELRLFRLLPRIVRDIQHLLTPDTGDTDPPERHDVPMVHLWDPQAGTLPAGVNYATETN